MQNFTVSSRTLHWKKIKIPTVIWTPFKSQEHKTKKVRLPKHSWIPKRIAAISVPANSKPYPNSTNTNASANFIVTISRTLTCSPKGMLKWKKPVFPPQFHKTQQKSIVTVPKNAVPLSAPLRKPCSPSRSQTPRPPIPPQSLLPPNPPSPRKALHSLAKWDGRPVKVSAPREPE